MVFGIRGGIEMNNKTIEKALSEIVFRYVEEIMEYLNKQNLSKEDEMKMFFSVCQTPILTMIDSQDISKEEKRSILNLVCEVMKKAGEEFK